MKWKWNQSKCQVKSDGNGVAEMKTSQNSFTGRKKCHFHHRNVENVRMLWNLEKGFEVGLNVRSLRDHPDSHQVFTSAGNVKWIKIGFD